MGEFILYDLAAKSGVGPWSPNVWKTRLVLNFKRLPYRTIRLEHADIEPTFKRLGIPPNDPGPHSPYSVPAVQLPGGEHIMESFKIAAELESRHPQPSLRLDSGLHARAGEAVAQAALPLIPVFMPRIPRAVLCESSVPYFLAAREKRFGMPLDQLERERGGEQAWRAAGPGVQALARLLSDHKVDQGPFILGSRASYGDFLIVAFLESLRRVGQDMFDRLVGSEETLKAVYEACREWLKE